MKKIAMSLVGVTTSLGLILTGCGGGQFEQNTSPPQQTDQAEQQVGKEPEKDYTVTVETPEQEVEESSPKQHEENREDKQTEEDPKPEEKEQPKEEPQERKEADPIIVTVTPKDEHEKEEEKEQAEDKSKFHIQHRDFLVDFIPAMLDIYNAGYKIKTIAQSKQYHDVAEADKALKVLQKGKQDAKFMLSIDPPEGFSKIYKNMIAASNTILWMYDYADKSSGEDAHIPEENWDVLAEKGAKIHKLFLETRNQLWEKGPCRYPTPAHKYDQRDNENHDQCYDHNKDYSRYLYKISH